MAYLQNVYRDWDWCLDGVYRRTVQNTGTGPGWQVSVGWLYWNCTQHCDQYTNVNIIVVTDKHWSKQANGWLQWIMISGSLTCLDKLFTLWIYLCLSKIEWQFKTITKLGIGQLMKIVTDMCFCPNTSSLLLALVSPLCSSFLGPIPETAVSAVWAVLISMGIFFVLLIRQGKILRKAMNWSADCTATPLSAFFWL